MVGGACELPSVWIQDPSVGLFFRLKKRKVQVPHFDHVCWETEEKKRRRRRKRKSFWEWKKVLGPFVQEFIFLFVCLIFIFSPKSDSNRRREGERTERERERKTTCLILCWWMNLAVRPSAVSLPACLSPRLSVSLRLGVRRMVAGCVAAHSRPWGSSSGFMEHWCPALNSFTRRSGSGTGCGSLDRVKSKGPDQDQLQVGSGCPQSWLWGRSSGFYCPLLWLQVRASLNQGDYRTESTQIRVLIPNDLRTKYLTKTQITRIEAQIVHRFWSWYQT